MTSVFKSISYLYEGFGVPHKLVDIMSPVLYEYIERLWINRYSYFELTLEMFTVTVKYCFMFEFWQHCEEYRLYKLYFLFIAMV